VPYKLTQGVTELTGLFTLRVIATGGRMIPLGNLPFAKRTLVGWMFGGPRKVGISLAEGLCNLGGGGNHFG
jgi:hypothetical protein